MRHKIWITISVFALLFCFAAVPASGLEVEREILLEINTTPQTNAAGELDLSKTPDLEAFLTRYQGALIRFALDLPEGRHQQFNRYLLVRLSPQDKDQVRAFIRDIAVVGSVHWAAPNYQFQASFYPDDPEFGEQWGAARIHAQDAWDITLGSAEIPIAIIDTGCDLDHEDLIGSIWINEDEVPDNGIDDDNNGFIDDTHGWDFVDAPTFPTGGDYLERDNDPSDEMGHGTAVAGICGAAIDNGIGVAGIAPNCPLMILRAGNANGFLQEDDVASAILYALDNGARVANMSFGDIQASPMLGDVIDYAAGQGLLMVAASGNNGTDQASFPAAFGPPLCVGSCDSDDARAWDSNYGTSLDLLAPGVGIYTTLSDDEYGLMPPAGSGTSFATPHVSAVAGLVFSLHPDWGPLEVKSILRGSTDDLPPSGWDPQTGHGILRADYAVQTDAALVAEITYPVTGQGLAQADSFDIIGTASGAYLETYQVLYGSGENPTSWLPLMPSERYSIVNDLLATWRSEDPVDSILTFRLVVTDIFGRDVDDRVTIYIDSTPPEISSIVIVPILDGNRPSYLLTFETDDVTSGKVWLKGIESGDERWISQTLGYETTDHIILLGRDLPLKEYQYYIWVENAAGLLDSTDILGIVDLGIHSIQSNQFVELPPPEIPPGYLFAEVSDFDKDSYLEVWADSVDASGNRTGLRVFEATN
ncbi:MAG: S8 family peptidase, partial [bacterium]